MNVLVTGHAGYLGTVMVPRLLDAGHKVTGLDTGFFEDCLFAGAELDPRLDSIPVIRRDIRNVSQKDLSGFDAVIHLAALSNDPMGNLDAELTREINLSASLRLAELAAEAGTQRFLFSSSCSTYGAAGDDFLDEGAEFHPVTPYGRCKVELEQALSELATKTEMSPVYLRNATAYGLSPRLRMDLVLNNLVGWAHTTGKVVLLSDGMAWRPIVHAQDIASAFLAALEAPREAVHDQAFNVGRTEHNYRIRELAEIVAEVVPNTEVVISEGASSDKRTYRVNCDKLAQTLPAFKPEWDARRSAETLYEAYKRAKLTEEQFRGELFTRLTRLESLMESDRIDARLHWR